MLRKTVLVRITKHEIVHHVLGKNQKNEFNIDVNLFCSYRGARHGLTMSAKLARLEQQEAEFMAKYGKKSQPTSASTVYDVPTTTPTTSQSAEQRSERQEETPNNTQRKKMKKKRSSGSLNELNGDHVSENPEIDVKLKKKKKKISEKAEQITDAVSPEDDVICVENGEVDHSHKTKRKHKKKKNKVEQKEEEWAPCKCPEETDELHTDTKVKKKKKSSQHHREEEESNYTESSKSEVVQDRGPKTKNKAGVSLEETEVAEKESTVKQKRKKCKRDKLSVDDSLNIEELPPKKKKKSKE